MKPTNQVHRGSIFLISNCTHYATGFLFSIGMSCHLQEKNNNVTNRVIKEFNLNNAKILNIQFLKYHVLNLSLCSVCRNMFKSNQIPTISSCWINSEIVNQYLPVIVKTRLEEAWLKSLIQCPLFKYMAIKVCGLSQSADMAYVMGIL